jgi:hypothetical protein
LLELNHPRGECAKRSALSEANCENEQLKLHIG